MRGLVAVPLALVLVGFAHAGALPGLPSFTGGYTAWTKLNARPIPPRSADPHSGVKNVFASKRRRGSAFPAGTVVVKEVRQPGRKWVYLVATMRKVAGSDRAHGDWRFVEYTRSGPRARFRVTAQNGVCWSCHAGARSRDWVFTRG